VTSPIVEWRDVDGELRPHRDGVLCSWAPQPGAQEAFLACTTTEVLLEGNRGGGKSAALLMSFAQHVGVGHGSEWRGILFRKTFPELRYLEVESQKWFSRIDHLAGAKYNWSTHEWRFPQGELLQFSYMDSPREFVKHQGHAYPWIGWDELHNWPLDEAYLAMFACLRSPAPGIPLQVRSTCNPGGVGHNWIKARWQLPLAHGVVRGPLIRTPGESSRRAIHSALRENRVLTAADPHYEDRIRTSADSPARLKAWLDGSWDVVAGGMFDDLWRSDVHVVPPIPADQVPRSWRLDRSYDDGHARPFSVGWWAQSSGEPVEWEGRAIGAVPGDLVQVGEWYGWNGRPNKGAMIPSREIADGILEREKSWGVAGRVRPGPADSAIWNASPLARGTSVASEMQARGVSWEPADKRAGSREQGWKAIRAMLKYAVPDASGRREGPGLFVSAACPHTLRTLPVLPRDDRRPDDVDTESEDHAGDMIRYRVRRPRRTDKPSVQMLY
jgi:hypothetical protein